MTTSTINHYLQFITKIEELAEGTRWFYHIGDNFIIEVTKITHDLKNKKDMMNLWKKHGYISEALSTHISIHTYYTDVNNNCYGYYNIQHKRSEDGKRVVIDFDYIKEFTPDNVNELLAECIRMSEMDIRNK